MQQIEEKNWAERKWQNCRALKQRSVVWSPQWPVLPQFVTHPDSPECWLSNEVTRIFGHILTVQNSPSRRCFKQTTINLSIYLSIYLWNLYSAPSR